MERVGRVTIYKRGSTYCLYYRERGKSVRQKVEGNLTSARSLASKVLAADQEGSLSPLAFDRTTVPDILDGFIQYCGTVKQLAPRSVDRYRAALDHLRTFSEECPSCATADHITAGTVEDFVTWMRQQTRARNGSMKGRTSGYSGSGIAFVLSTWRTAFNWGKRRRYLPPYSENPFSAFGVDQARDRGGVVGIRNKHLLRVLREYVDYYNISRTHLSLEKDAPEHRQPQSPEDGNNIVSIPVLGGLHYRYERVRPRNAA